MKGERKRESESTAELWLLCGSINIALWPRSHKNLLKDQDVGEEKKQLAKRSSQAVTQP